MRSDDDGSSTTASTPSTPQPVATSTLFRTESGDEEDELPDEGSPAPVPSSVPPAASTAAVASTSSAPNSDTATTATATAFSPARAPLPHYTVQRSASTNSESSPHKVIINPGLTDASPTNWPDESRWRNGAKVNGQLNWYENEPADKGRHYAWRKQLGAGLARELGLNESRAGGKPEHFLLERFPDNYKFSVHHTWKAGAAKERTDIYLWGWRQKFRTPNEFLPHLVWLLTVAPDNQIRCACKYCTKSTQSDVNRAIGLVGHRSASLTPTSSPARPAAAPTASTSAAATTATTSTTAAASTTKEKKKSRLSNVAMVGASSSSSGEEEEDIEQPDTSPEKKRKGKKRASDRPAIVPSGSKRVPRPISVASSSALSTSVPAPPKKRRLASPAYDGAYVHPKREGDLKGNAPYREGELVWYKLARPFVDQGITQWPAVVIGRSTGVESTRVGTEPDGRTPIFKNVEYPVYNIRPLAVAAKELAAVNEELLPYHGQSSLPDDWFLTRMEDERVKKELARVYDGDRVLRPSFAELDHWTAVVIPLALAMQTVYRIVEKFCAIDVYRPKRSYALTNGDLSKEEEKKLESELAKPFFQRIKWGPEIIWTGELVRIHVRPKDVEKMVKTHARGWNERAVFLRITAIWRDSTVASGESVPMDCLRVSGRLYELESVYEEFDPTLGTIIGKKLVDTSSLSTSSSKKADDDDARFPSMPTPPPGYRWFKLRLDKDVTFTVEHLAGRYYELPAHLKGDAKRTEEIRRHVVETKLKEDTITLTNDERAVVLAGLISAGVAFSRPKEWSESIQDSLAASEEGAQDDMKRYFDGWI